MWSFVHAKHTLPSLVHFIDSGIETYGKVSQSESQAEYLAETELVPGLCYSPKKDKSSVSPGNEKSQELSMERHGSHQNVSPVQKLDR